MSLCKSNLVAADLQENSTVNLDLAVRALRAGAVVAYPTEAVWGLGCDPASGESVHRLLTLKGRAASKGLILVAGSIEQVGPYLAQLPADLRTRVLQSWPGPVTWLLPALPATPRWVTGSNHRVALRVSNHFHVKALCLGFGGPIVSTSANPAGRPPARQEWVVRRYFGNDIDFVLPGQTGGAARPSEIRDALSGQVLRA